MKTPNIDLTCLYCGLNAVNEKRCTLCVLLFFYKNIFYKIIEAEFCTAIGLPRIKNKISVDLS